MRPRFIGRLGPADAVTTLNGVLGFVAIVYARADPEVAARLVLLAAIGDGLDGVVARHVRSTAVGEHLDSLADVVSFGAAPAVVVVGFAFEAWDLSVRSLSPELVLAITVPALFVAMVVVRLGLYTAFDAGNHHTKGVPSTLAATLLAALVLTRIPSPTTLLAATAVLAYLMVTRIQYPDLLARDALLMGIVQGLAVIVPEFYGRTFPYALLVLGLAYLVLAPRFYWRTIDAAGG